MNLIRFFNVMNNTEIKIALKIDNNNIAKIRTQHRQMMATITNGVLKSSHN